MEVITRYLNQRPIPVVTGGVFTSCTGHSYGVSTVVDSTISLDGAAINYSGAVNTISFGTVAVRDRVQELEERIDALSTQIERLNAEFTAWNSSIDT